MSTKNEGADVQSTNELIITRTFNAPRELVFKAFTEAKSLAKWWGPKGVKLNVSRLEVKPGGEFLYNMEAPDGKLMWGKFVYKEIQAPERIIFVSSFSDEKGNVARNPFMESFPLEIRNTLILTENKGTTTLTLRGGPINSTQAELDIYTQMMGGMEQGFKGTFDQLEEYLKELTA